MFNRHDAREALCATPSRQILGWALILTVLSEALGILARPLAAPRPAELPPSVFVAAWILFVATNVFLYLAWMGNPVGKVLTRINNMMALPAAMMQLISYSHKLQFELRWATSGVEHVLTVTIVLLVFWEWRVSSQAIKAARPSKAPTVSPWNLR